MPLREFKCLACQGVTEKLLSIHDTTENIMCGICGEHTAKRIISRGSFILKGAGFYSNDYRANTSAGTEDHE